MKILILKPSSLGDVIQALPVLRLLKLHLPSSRIYWWIDSNLAPLLRRDPDLDGLILFDRRRWRSPWRWAEVWRSVHHIRQHRFDWVIDLQGLLRSSLMAWLANGRFTVGVDDPREGAGAFFDIAVPRPSPRTHAVDWYLKVLGPLGVPIDRPFDWLPRNPEAAETFDSQVAPAAGRWIALQPGARWGNKRWPVEHFAETIRKLIATDRELRFVVLGGGADRDLGSFLTQVAPAQCMDLTGRTTLPEMIEWIRRAALLITNDTGPMHAAAAMGKPVVALFGPTDPRRTGPYGQTDQVLQHRLPCVPCLKDSCRWPVEMECLRALTPDAVVERARRHLAALPRPASA